MTSPDTTPGVRERLHAALLTLSDTLDPVEGPVILAWSVDVLADRLAEALTARPGPKHAAPPPVDCLDHKPIQHRDMRPPWCPRCGLTEDYQEPTR